MTAEPVPEFAFGDWVTVGGRLMIVTYVTRFASGKTLVMAVAEDGTAINAWAADVLFTPAQPPTRHVRPDDGRVRVFRCDACGKWSTAQRRPRNHQRFLAADRDDCERLGMTVLADAPGVPSSEYNDGTLDGVFIACGPFHPWIAYPEAS